MRCTAVCCVVLTAITLGAGLGAVAYQSSESQDLVDPPMERARHILIDPAETEYRRQPIALRQYTAASPASSRPILRWSRVDGAVMYDVQLLKRRRGGPSQRYEPVMAAQRVYNTACEVKLPDDCREPVLYWRVKPLNLRGQDIGPFSELEPLPIDWQKQEVLKPVPLSVYNQGRGQTLLYPVYDWIAIPDAGQYEVEILDAPPENPNGTEPSIHRIAAYRTPIAHQYDHEARLSEKPFYWRVRAIGSDGSPLGVYSDASSYTTDPSQPCEAAVYGDSISHGGGSVSYSPADWEFSYGHYLDFPVVNLSFSGDTSRTAVERFDKDVVPFHPPYLLILMGTNSLRAGVEPAEVIADMKRVKEKCLAYGIRPVFLTLPPLRPDNIRAAFGQDTVRSWREAIAAVNAYVKTQVHVDITPGMEDERGELREDLAVDGLHLDPPGKRLMAEAINAAWPDITALPDDAWQTES